MPLVPAKCTQCGANLDVDSSQEAAICPHCKTPFVTEKAINYFNTTNVTNIDTINAEVVNVESSDSASTLSRTAETLLNFGEWDKAKDIYVKIAQMYPFDWRGWYGLLQTNTHNFQLQFERYEEYNALVEIYEKLIVVSDKSMPNIAIVGRYLDNIYEKVETTISNNYKREQQFLQERIPKENALVKDEIPLEVKDKKTLGTKITKIIWLVWAAIAFLVSLVQGIIKTISWDWLDIELNIGFGVFRFDGLYSFLSIVLFMSVFMLIIQVVVSFVLFIIGIFGIAAQIYSKQKRLTAFKFITKCSIIAVSSQLIFWFIAIWFSDMIEFAQGYNNWTDLGHYGINTVLFHSNTATCWVALLLIIIYSVINYVLIAAPLFATERIGDKKRSAILLNIKHKQELVRLTQQKDTLPKRYNEDLLKLKMLRDKHL